MALNFKENPTLLSAIEMCPIQVLKIGRLYQRDLETPRMESIYKKILKRGFLPIHPLLITKDYWIIDGQHRVKAAEKAGLKEVPVWKAPCNTFQEELELFVEENTHDTRLKPVILWYARNLGNHPLANLIHKLNTTKDSLLFDKIAERGYSIKGKFTIAQILVFVGCALLNSCHHWEQKVDSNWCERIQKMTDEHIIERMNFFIKWFFLCFGEIKNENKKGGSSPYADGSQRAIACLYVLLRRTGIFMKGKRGPSLYKTSIEKMKTFDFTDIKWRLSHAYRVDMLVNHWNSKRHDYKVKYTPQDLQE